MVDGFLNIAVLDLARPAGLLHGCISSMGDVRSGAAERVSTRPAVVGDQGEGNAGSGGCPFSGGIE